MSTNPRSTQPVLVDIEEHIADHLAGACPFDIRGVCLGVCYSDRCDEMPEVIVLGGEGPVFRPGSPIRLVYRYARHAILVPNAKIAVNDRNILHARIALKNGGGLLDSIEVIDHENRPARMRELLGELYALLDEKLTEFPVHQP